MNMQVAKDTVVTLDYNVTDPDGELVDAKLREQLAGFVQGFATFAAARRR